MTVSTALETRILLLRHAETAAPDLFHGAESDVGLGERGWAQARAVAAKIAPIRPDAVYSSGMRRAAETARVIADACGLEDVGVCPGMHERRMGSLSGKPRAEGWPLYAEAKDQWIAGQLGWTHPGGESFEAMALRAVAAIHALLDRERGRTTVLVAHGVVNRVLICSLALGYSAADYDRVPIDFVGVHDLRWDGSTLRVADVWAGEPTPPLRPTPRRS